MHEELTPEPLLRPTCAMHRKRPIPSPTVGSIPQEA